MPAVPRWLQSIPSAVVQLERMQDGRLITRRDLQHLFGASRTRAAALMKLFGGEIVAGGGVVRREDLLAQLRVAAQGEEFRREARRRTLLGERVERAALTGIRFTVTRAALEARLGDLSGVTIERGRIEVRCGHAVEGAERLYALAQALQVDFAAFKRLIEGTDVPA